MKKNIINFKKFSKKKIETNRLSSSELKKPIEQQWVKNKIHKEILLEEK